MEDHSVHVPAEPGTYAPVLAAGVAPKVPSGKRKRGRPRKDEPGAAKGRAQQPVRPCSREPSADEGAAQLRTPGPAAAAAAEEGDAGGEVDADGWTQAQRDALQVGPWCPP